jgi:glutamate-1-semialdehyde 2,1-aminomutase
VVTKITPVRGTDRNAVVIGSSFTARERTGASDDLQSRYRALRAGSDFHVDAPSTQPLLGSFDDAAWLAYALLPEGIIDLSATPDAEALGQSAASFDREAKEMERIHSQAEWIERASAVLPAGGFGNFDASIVIRNGRGSRVWDEDGNEYIDYLIGSGPMLLGHGHPEVLEAVLEQLPKGATFFANNASGIALAEEICAAVPCAEQLRYVTSGGEANMYAIRAARVFTGRDKILKFEGGYHGMSAEAQMSLAPSHLVDFPQAVMDSGGIPQAVADEMLIAPFNDVEFVRSLIAEFDGQIAGIIVEPLQRIIPPAPGFLAALREECTKAGIVLIFDEVVTGFRFSYGGAQELYGVTPDLCSLGKLIGGGFPLAAIAGRKEIMDHFDESIVGAERWLMQLGTLSGNPIASQAGRKTLEILRRKGNYKLLSQSGQRLMDLFARHLNDAGIPHRIVGHQTLFDVVFIDRDVNDYRDVFAADGGRNAAFNEVLRAEGIFKSASKTYASLALTEADFEQTDAAIRKAAQSL